MRILLGFLLVVAAAFAGVAARAQTLEAVVLQGLIAEREASSGACTVKASYRLEARDAGMKAALGASGRMLVASIPCINLDAYTSYKTAPSGAGLTFTLVRAEFTRAEDGGCSVDATFTRTINDAALAAVYGATDVFVKHGSVPCTRAANMLSQAIVPKGGDARWPKTVAAVPLTVAL